MRAATTGLVDRLGSFELHTTRTWQPLVTALGLGDSAVASAATANGGTTAASDAAAATLLVGSPADMLRHVAHATGEFGFVVPVAQIARWWQRAPQWRDETMLDLWSNGWTPVAIDRVVTAKQDAAVEFAIGNARLTPAVIESD